MESSLTRFASGLVAFKGKLFFSAKDPLHDQELWVSDGTAEGTGLFKDIKTFDTTYNCGRYMACTDSSSYPASFTVHNGSLYFAANDGIHGNELWKSDGTPEGTVMVKDIFPGPTPSASGPEQEGYYNFATVGNNLLFDARNELWKTDGTQNGTIRLTGAESSIPYSPVFWEK